MRTKAQKYFSSMEMYPSEDMLYQEEIDAVVAVLGELLELFGEHRPNQGTIVLDGQAKGEGAFNILWTNLELGAYRRYFFRTQERTSDAMANETIDAILYWPEKPLYGYEADKLRFGELPTMVYADGANKALVLNTTLGRFVMSVYLVHAEESKPGEVARFIDYYDGSIAVMKALALTLAKMGKEDIVLQRSVRELMTGLMAPQQRILNEKVDELFAKCELPELAAWKKWHEAATSEGLAVFFG